jgi:oxepin-CoA hydrolase/3-oxo-5,6-dehydrosuberyl-CoA semialdehyde dehydrogenase
MQTTPGGAPTTRFDVNDADLRESFLRGELMRAIAGLSEGSVARWGRMRPQEMVEHLGWAMRLSTGLAATECHIDTADLPRMKRFLYSNRPSPREFMNPALVAGLPALQFASLDEAKVELALELNRFLEGPRASEAVFTHPVFGPIGYDEWHRTHYKHAHHHLQQFGLIESGGDVP